MAGDDTVIVRHLSTLYERLNRAITGLRSPVVYFVPDHATWAFYWVAHYLAGGLREHWGLPTRTTFDPWALRHRIIHFVDRYAYLHGPFRDLHPSNRVFLTWFHGDPSNTNPGMRALMAILPEAAGRLEKIVVPCRMAGRELLKLGIPEAKVATIPLGVDLARFTPVPEEARRSVRAGLGISERAICIGSFQKDGEGWEEGGEPKLVKGPDVFLEVIATLASRYDNLLVILTGPARGYVKRGLERLGVPYRHQFLSAYHDIVRYYHALDLYLISSRCEGGPLPLLESWATGVPVVSTNVGMAADLIQHGRNGMLAEVEDAGTLAKHAMEVIENTALRERCRAEGLVDARRYDWARIAEQYYHDLYQPLLK